MNRPPPSSPPFPYRTLSRPPMGPPSVSMIPETPGGAGVVAPAGNVAALAEAIGRLLKDRGEAETLGRRARERCVARYSFAAARRVLFPLIDDVARRHKGSR